MTGGEWEAVAWCVGLPTVSWWCWRVFGPPGTRHEKRAADLVDRQQDELRWRQQVNQWRMERGWPVLDVTDDSLWRRQNHSRTGRKCTRDTRPKGMKG